MDIFAQVAGWIGVVLILVSYLLVSTGRANPKGFWYQISNLLGAVGISFNSYAMGAYPSVAVNIVWSMISIYALYNLFMRKV